jgi:hypothetical protein
MKKILICGSLLALAACTENQTTARITHDPVVAMVKAKPRSEPVFYNGKNYIFDFAPAQGGGYALAVNGLTAKQQKDAMNIANSAFHYYNCKDSQKAVPLTKPSYVNNQWVLTAHCV